MANRDHSLDDRIIYAARAEFLSCGFRTHIFEWLEFDRLKDEYYYPLFLKKEIFDLPSEFTIRTETE